MTARRIRRGGPGDAEFVRLVARQVFAHLGDYAYILPSWLDHEGVVTHVAEEDAEGGFSPCGFTLVGAYPEEVAGREVFVADLLAIAVAPASQRRGIGSELLEHAIGAMRAARRALRIRQLRLSVPELNDGAQRLYQRHGFQVVPGDHGRYDGGQRALHMARPID